MSLRYVILHHTDVPEPHYDLMFETAPGSALATWRTPTWPGVASPEPIADHRRDYLDYQGPIRHNRGRVHRVASGVYTMESDTPDKLIAVLDTGRRLSLPRSNPEVR